MLAKSFKMLLLVAASILLDGCSTPCGAPGGRLCAPVFSITSVAAAPTATPTASPRLAPAPEPEPPPQPDALQAAPPAPERPPQPAPLRIGLLLPLRSPTLGPAAESVRAGFLAAHQREPDGVVVDVIEAGAAGADPLTQYAEAEESEDVIVGPLARPAVTALATSALVRKPTLALNHPEAHAGADPSFANWPAQLLVIGLSLEDEARQVAAWAESEQPDARAVIVAAGAPWQKRVAHAFAEQWRRDGRAVETVELSSLDGKLSDGEIEQLGARLDKDGPALLLAALDAGQTRQLRAVLGGAAPLYGTSALNAGAARAGPELDGARLLDLPWLLQRDHPAVMAYPEPAADPGQPDADMARLYALGIDAYRIAREIGRQPVARFELDGVTGRLAVSFGQGPAHFERLEQAAVYRGAEVAPLPEPEPAYR
jgi:uncharacterized protein